MMFKKYIVPFIIGLFGVATALILWHSYIDHMNLHAIINGIQFQQNQKK